MPARRRLLEIGIWTGLTLLAGAVTGILASVVVAPLRRTRQQEWLFLADLEQLSGWPQAFPLEHSLQQGWYRQPLRIPLYAYLDREGQPIVLSPVCTHLGCMVRWEAEAGLFSCPCHGGLYDAQGRVVEGPPPRDLQHLATRVQEGKIFVRSG